MENYLNNLSTVVPLDDLRAMRATKELKPYLPFSIGGIDFEWDDSVQADTAASKVGSFLVLSNTPAVQNITKEYLPKKVVEYLKSQVDRDYDPELAEWEGDFDAALKPRGGRNAFHLLEQVSMMGPRGQPTKRGPAPIRWPVFYRAQARLEERFSAMKGLEAKHLAIGTPASTPNVLQFAHVLQNSAGEPYVSDPNTIKTAKKYHVSKALRYAASFLASSARSIPLWRFLVFARGDRAADYPLYLDNEAARSDAVQAKRDRKIDAQSFNLQLLDGIFTQAIADATSNGPYPEVDMREPHRLSNHLVDGAAAVKRHGVEAFSIGGDESAWDQSVTPQGWYASYLFYREMFRQEQNILYFDYNGPLLIDEAELIPLKNLGVGLTRALKMRSPTEDGYKIVDCNVTRIAFKTDDILRRMFAGASGTGARMGNIIASGFQEVLDTPRDGKILLGWSMRSGNFCTFYCNSIINIHKLYSIEEGSKDEDTLNDFEKMHGYRPPVMELVWSVVRGDDSGAVWLVKDKSQEWKISELFADWISLYGGNANAKKQDTSDVRGRWRIGFAQKFSNENFPRGVSSVVRVGERNIWNESDEVITVDPDTGESFRDVLQVMNTYGRINNLWGVWDSEVHPRAKELTAALQDLDELRILPPLDEEERRLAAKAYALKLFRRGQISSSQIDDAVRHFWSTELAQYALQRYESTPRLQGPNYPLKRYEPDSRKIWRGSKQG